MNDLRYAIRSLRNAPAFAAACILTLGLGIGATTLIYSITDHVVIRPLALAIPLSALLWLLAGGIAYTTGVLFFLNQRLRYSHFIWHLFVLGGTTCHFAAVISCMA